MSNRIPAEPENLDEYVPRGDFFPLEERRWLETNMTILKEMLGDWKAAKALGVEGTFTSQDGKTITVVGGLITEIA